MPVIPPRPNRSGRGFAAMAALAATLSASAALGADKPPTPEGADQIKALVAKFFPAAQAGASPLVTVTVRNLRTLTLSGA